MYPMKRRFLTVCLVFIGLQKLAEENPAGIVGKTTEEKTNSLMKSFEEQQKKLERLREIRSGG